MSYFQDGQWHESTAHSGSVTGPVLEPSPDDVTMNAHAVISGYLKGFEISDPYGTAKLVVAGLKRASCLVPASRLAAAEAQRDDLLAENEQQLQEITDLAEQLDAARATLDRLGHAVTEAGSARAAQLAVLAILNPPEETL